ncbi:hypothetical protein AVEN_219459-1 [Araneus ventricosus]|uniref:Uncharacterized protein n=1 Tax=Araneus ventricosus TaxID=182803 RepID=A0A4Y2BNZ1_ARAVE|nr:hypothetical protein AVEN_219459-1 [Araneus ventricosus]
MRYSSNSVTVYPKAVRLDIQLNEPGDSSYNSVSYAKLLNLQLGKDIESSDLLGLTTEDTFDRFKDYEEESYIDNTEVYRDTLPAGKEPELGGFYINTGKLKLKSSFVAPNSVDKNKKGGKKKISAKIKAAQTKTIRKKESSRPKVKKPKHENTKISVHNNMYSNIRLDTLLKTVRKQKKKSIVRSINMSSTSKHSSVTGASKKAKEICKITPKKKVHSTKKCCADTSVATKVILNSTEVTIPREDFLSSKNGSFNSLSSTSDSDEVEILKEIVHSVYENNDEHTFVKNNLTLKTAVTSESSQVATSKTLHSPSAIISKELCLSLNSTFVSSNPILDSKIASSTSFPTAVSKNAFHSSSQVAVEPDFITFNPVLKTKKQLSLPKATVPKNINSNRKVTTDSTLAANSSVPNTAVRSSSSKATIASACSNSSKTTKALICSSSSKATIASACSSSSKTTKASMRSSSTKATNKPVRSSSSKSTVPKAEFHSSCHSTTEYSLFQDVPLMVPKSNSSKAIIKAINSSSSKAIISPIHSTSPEATIPKEVLYSYRKISSDSAFIFNSPVLNTEVRSSSSKATMPKEVLLSSCAKEFALCQEVPLTKPTGNILANKKDSCPANPWGNLKVNSTSPKAISKYMLNVIHDNGANNIPSNSISASTPKSQSDLCYYDNSLESDKNSIRTYSKDDKNSFQPIMKNNPAATSSVAVSQTKQATVMNSMHSSCSNTTAIKMYKMNISPIVKYKEPHGKF